MHPVLTFTEAQLQKAEALAGDLSWRGSVHATAGGR